MKSRFTGLVLMFMLVALTACNKNDDKEDEPSKHSANATEQAGEADTVAVSKTKAVESPSREFSDFDPNPIRVCDGSGLGQTTISWDAPGVSSIEVHINTPTGPLMARGESGSKQTGKWVTDGMIFILMDGSNGKILDQIKVEHTKEGCP